MGLHIPYIEAAVAALGAGGERVRGGVLRQLPGRPVRVRRLRGGGEQRGPAPRDARLEPTAQRLLGDTPQAQPQPQVVPPPHRAVLQVELLDERRAAAVGVPPHERGAALRGVRALAAGLRPSVRLSKPARVASRGPAVRGAPRALGGGGGRGGARGPALLAVLLRVIPAVLPRGERRAGAGAGRPGGGQRGRSARRHAVQGAGHHRHRAVQLVRRGGGVATGAPRPAGPRVPDGAPGGLAGPLLLQLRLGGRRPSPQGGSPPPAPPPAVAARRACRRRRAHARAALVGHGLRPARLPPGRQPGFLRRQLLHQGADVQLRVRAERVAPGVPRVAVLRLVHGLRAAAVGAGPARAGRGGPVACAGRSAVEPAHPAPGGPPEETDDGRSAHAGPLPAGHQPAVPGGLRDRGARAVPAVGRLLHAGGAGLLPGGSCLPPCQTRGGGVLPAAAAGAGRARGLAQRGVAQRGLAVRQRAGRVPPQRQGALQRGQERGGRRQQELRGPGVRDRPEAEPGVRPGHEQPRQHPAGRATAARGGAPAEESRGAEAGLRSGVDEPGDSAVEHAEVSGGGGELRHGPAAPPELPGLPLQPRQPVPGAAEVRRRAAGVDERHGPEANPHGGLEQHGHHAGQHWARGAGGAGGPASPGAPAR
ncbi:collagen alpha-1(III) chain-like isoform X7 [Bacillus rossius redtenbacheri]|uniref:collagen alpha-1(III) chain-like isoform X7 n=1 Tax=Bacillus rossius redtenbacheri TaxID=93214 RepID=UPI002FDDA790